MNEGLLNRGLANAVARQGHGDELIVCDAGFAIPDGVEVVDLSLGVNLPTVETVLAELLKYHSVEKLVIADRTGEHSPAKLASVMELLPAGIPVDVIGHPELKARARTVKTVVRTGDFTAFSNFLLVSGSGDRWYSER
ncbi:MAG: D-ribose pyranase [Planctomycetota bacterium]|jgi:D-ribose pyranase|nr:D-ribose pyranase [Planctomycetota bacterium]